MSFCLFNRGTNSHQIKESSWTIGPSFGSCRASVMQKTLKWTALLKSQCLAMSWAGAAGSIMQVLWSLLEFMQVNRIRDSCKRQESPPCCVTTSISKLSFCPKQTWANCYFLQFFNPSWFFIGLQASRWNFLLQGSSLKLKVESEQFKLGFALPAAYMQLVGGWVSAYILSWVFLSWVLILLILPY